MKTRNRNKSKKAKRHYTVNQIMTQLYSDSQERVWRYIENQGELGFIFR